MVRSDLVQKFRNSDLSIFFVHEVLVDGGNIKALDLRRLSIVISQVVLQSIKLNTAKDDEEKTENKDLDQYDDEHVAVFPREVRLLLEQVRNANANDQGIDDYLNDSEDGQHLSIVLAV